MVPFAMALRQGGSATMKTFQGILADDMHNIQTHVDYMQWLVSSSSCFWACQCCPNGIPV